MRLEDLADHVATSSQQFFDAFQNLLNLTDPSDVVAAAQKVANYGAQLDLSSNRLLEYTKAPEQNFVETTVLSRTITVPSSVYVRSEQDDGNIICIVELQNLFKFTLGLTSDSLTVAHVWVESASSPEQCSILVNSIAQNVFKITKYMSFEKAIDIVINYRSLFHSKCSNCGNYLSKLDHNLPTEFQPESKTFRHPQCK
ncbi:hypothetical protein P9112_014659 [Eukaryota sp. TZLM1-RC]